MPKPGATANAITGRIVLRLRRRAPAAVLKATRAVHALFSGALCARHQQPAQVNHGRGFPWVPSPFPGARRSPAGLKLLNAQHVAVRRLDFRGRMGERQGPFFKPTRAAHAPERMAGVVGGSPSTPNARQRPPQPRQCGKGPAGRLKSLNAIAVLDGSIRAGQPPWVLACGSRATSNSRIGPSFVSWCLIRSNSSSSVAPSAPVS